MNVYCTVHVKMEVPVRIEMDLIGALVFPTGQVITANWISMNAQIPVFVLDKVTALTYLEVFIVRVIPDMKATSVKTILMNAIEKMSVLMVVLA